MPFDQSSWVVDDRELSDLIRQADEALDTSNRAACIAIISEIYSLLDDAAASHVVSGPTLTH